MLKKTKQKTTKYSRNEATLKIGHQSRILFGNVDTDPYVQKMEDKINAA